MINISWQDVAERNGDAWADAEAKLLAIREYVIELPSDENTTDDVELALCNVREDIIALLDDES